MVARRINLSLRIGPGCRYGSSGLRGSDGNQGSGIERRIRGAAHPPMGVPRNSQHPMGCLWDIHLVPDLVPEVDDSPR